MLSIFIRLLSYLRRLFPLAPVGASSVLEDDLTVYTLRSYNDYISYRKKVHVFEGCSDLVAVERQEQRALPFFASHGICSVCNTKRNFYTDFRYADVEDGLKKPNWRERMICLHCLLCNRQRAAYHLFVRHCQPGKYTKIYITEQYTAYFRMLKSRFTSTTGSEYLGDVLPLGEKDKKGRRNEDLCALTFGDASFDVVLTYDVLEHIPDYNAAILEMYRVLNPGGRLMISVPFAPSSAENIVRARLSVDGAVEHLLEPEYHGDPLKSDGCLCYYHFGWELLDDLRHTGFEDVCLLFYWSKAYGYLGGEQVMICAKKPE